MGEAPEELVLVGHVKRSEDTEVAAPRDLRLCASCERVNVFVPLSSLDGTSAAPVR